MFSGNYLYMVYLQLKLIASGICLLIAAFFNQRGSLPVPYIMGIRRGRLALR